MDGTQTQPLEGSFEHGQPQWPNAKLTILLRLKATETAVYAIYIGVFLWGFGHHNVLIRRGPTFRGDVLTFFTFPNWLPLAGSLACMIAIRSIINCRTKTLIDIRPASHLSAIIRDGRLRFFWMMVAMGVWPASLPWFFDSMPQSPWTPLVFACIAGSLAWLRVWSEAMHGYPVPAPNQTYAGFRVHTPPST